MFEPLENLGVEHIYGYVENVEDHGDFKTVLTDDQTYETRTVIVATGSKHRPLGVPGEEELNSRGVLTVLCVMVLSSVTKICW